jgi:NADH-quinone oxidoreductase subunit G
MAEEKKLFKVTIDNISIEVEPGTTILMAARRIGADVTPPAMCFYSKLKGSGGKCRTCLVEVAAVQPLIETYAKVGIGCRTTVMDGMIVKNYSSDRVKEARAGVVEFIT